VRRLLPPLWLYGSVLVALMIWQGWTVTRAEGSRLDSHAALAWLVPLEQPGGSAWGDEFVVPLWYIRTYLWLLLLSPALYWLFRRHPRLVLATPLALLGVLELHVVPVTAATGDTLSHLGTFSTCWLVGFAHRDGSLARVRRGRTVLIGLGLMALGLAWAFTHQLPETRWNIDEIPVADALYGLGAVVVLLRLYPRRPVLAAVPWLAGPVAAMNARAMTVYLWGNAAIAATTPVIESNRWTRDLSAPTWQGLVAQYAATWVIVVVIVLAFGWVEDVAAGRAPRLNPWPRRNPSEHTVQRHWTPGRSNAALAALAAALTIPLVVGVLGAAGRAAPPSVGDGDGPLPATTAARAYPVHVRVPASVFRIGVLVPGQGDDGQSLRSGWDRNWAAHFGGCDGYGSVGAACRSDLAGRTPPDWFPRALVPKENPFYVGLPYNDLDDPGRRAAIPWAHDQAYREHLADPSFSLLKNRWVQVTGPTGSCYAQVEDTGPGPSDAAYVLGVARPAHTPAINLSPSLARCVGVTDASPAARVDWAFVDRPPAGPWTAVPTTRQSDQDGRRQ
jgi:hypothetical protein